MGACAVAAIENKNTSQLSKLKEAVGSVKASIQQDVALEYFKLVNVD